MKKYNLIYLREPKLFDKKGLRVTKIESIVEAVDIKDAIKQSHKIRTKDFVLRGIKQLSVIIILFLLSGCVTVKHWRHPETKKIEYTNPAKFF
jgi:hypothetical protein